MIGINKKIIYYLSAAGLLMVLNLGFSPLVKADPCDDYNSAECEEYLRKNGKTKDGKIKDLNQPDNKATSSTKPQKKNDPHKCGSTDTNIIGGELCEGVDNKSGDIKQNAIFVLLRKLIALLSGLVGVVAVIMIVVAGVLYATAGDKDEQVSKAKTMITNTVIGIILYIFMTLILQFLVPGGILQISKPTSPTSQQKIIDKAKDKGIEEN